MTPDATVSPEGVTLPDTRAWTEELVRRIVADVTIPDEARLWTAEDIGHYLHLSPRTVSEKLSVHPGFPKSLRLGVKRWYMTEVLAWAKRTRR